MIKFIIMYCISFIGGCVVGYSFRRVQEIHNRIKN